MYVVGFFPLGTAELCHLLDEFELQFFKQKVH